MAIHVPAFFTYALGQSRQVPDDRKLADEGARPLDVKVRHGQVPKSYGAAGGVI
jgi:hypothetical protein